MLLLISGTTALMLVEKDIKDLKMAERNYTNYVLGEALSNDEQLEEIHP